MADRHAVATGVWSDPATWDGGTDLPAPGDGVYANGFVVTVDQDIDVAFLANDDLGGTLDPDGHFEMNTADSASNTLVFSDGLDGIAHMYPATSASTAGFPCLMLVMAGDGSSMDVSGNIVGPVGPTSGPFPATTFAFAALAGTAALSITGGLDGGPGGGAAVLALGVITVTGDVYGGTGDADHTAPGIALYTVPGGVNTINGSIYGGNSTLSTGGASMAVLNGGDLHIVGGSLIHGNQTNDWPVATPAMGSVTGVSSLGSTDAQDLVAVNEPSAVVTDNGDGTITVTYDGSPPDPYQRALDLETIFTDLSTIITAPTDLVAVFEGGIVNVSWTAPDPTPETISYYDVEWSSYEDFSITAGTTVIGVEDPTTYTIEGSLEPGPMFVRVRAVGATLTGLWATTTFAVPGISGWLTVSATGLVGLADTSDLGDAPDLIPVVGSITLTPGLGRPIRLIAEGMFMAVGAVTATFDSEGHLSYDGMEDIRLIAPLWENLSNTTWKWVADIRPGLGQSWSAFSVSFTGAPGDVINLASLI